MLPTRRVLDHFGLLLFARVVSSTLTAGSGAAAHDLNICILIADTQTGQLAYRKYAAVIDYAIKEANNVLLLPNITLRKFHLPETPLSSGRCIAGCAATRALALLKAGVKCHVFLGPDTPNGVNNVYGIAYTNNIPILSTAAYGIASRERATLLTEMFLNTKDAAEFVVKFTVFRNFTYVVVFHDESDELFTSMGNEFYKAFSEYYKKTDLEDNHLRIASVQFNKDLTSGKELRLFFNYASTKARVIVVFTLFETFKKLLMVADEIGMTDKDYNYVTVHPYDDPFYGYTDISYIKQNRDQLPLLTVLQGNIFVISLRLIRPPFFANFQDEIKLASRIRYNYTFHATETIDALVTVHYDAIMMLASSIITLNQNKDLADGILLSNATKGRSYNGLQTGEVRIDETGMSRLSYDVIGVAAGTSEFTTIWVYESKTNIFREIRPTTAHPISIPRCGFSGDAAICQSEKKAATDILVVSLSATLPFIVVVAFLVWFSVRTIRRLKIHQNIDWWKVALDELQFRLQKPISGRLSTTSSLQSHMTNASKALASYRGVDVSVEDVASFGVRASSVIAKHLDLHRTINSDYLRHFTGICLDKSDSFIWLVSEHCAKGDLTTFLAPPKLKLDWSIKNSFIRDLAQGMSYLHSTEFVSHGNLSSNNCLIDGRLTLKIAGYGHPYFRSAESLLPLTKNDAKRNCEELLWRAPELLSISMQPNGTQEGDVYSFGIILQQIILECYPYETGEEASFSSFDIAIQVKSSNIPPTRPSVPRSACSVALYELMEVCWSEFPLERPSFEKTCENLRKTLGNLKDNIVDQLMKRMEEYASNLEEQVAEKTILLVEEKRKSDELLCLILPRSVAAALIKGERVEPESYESVTLYFSDVVGFTTISAALTPLRVIDFLNALYTTFDNVLELYDAYKVETIGDAYMIVSGLPLRNGWKHITEMCTVALHIREEILSFNVPGVTKSPVRIRIGLNTGPCVAGVVGLKMPRYCLFGDTVNTASRMESTGEAMKIQITEKTKTCLDVVGGFVVQTRGEIEVKGKGMMETFWLISKALM